MNLVQLKGDEYGEFGLTAEKSVTQGGVPSV